MIFYVNLTKSATNSRMVCTKCFTRGLAELGWIAGVVSISSYEWYSISSS